MAVRFGAIARESCAGDMLSEPDEFLQPDVSQRHRFFHFRVGSSVAEQLPVKQPRVGSSPTRPLDRLETVGRRL